MKTKLLILLLLAAGGIVTAQGYTLENMKWGPGTVAFYLDLGSFYDAVATKDLGIWDQYTGRTRLTTTINATTNGGFWFMDGRSSIEWSSAAGVALPGNILAVTAINGDSGRLAESDILVNQNFQWGSYDGPSGNGYDMGRVLLHEIGHAIGLGHSLDDAAIMSPYYHSRVWELTADDIAGARALYGPQSVPEGGRTLPLLGLALAGMALFGVAKRMDK